MNDTLMQLMIRDDFAQLIHARETGRHLYPAWPRFEIDMPNSTLTNKFVRVYVTHDENSGRFIVSDGGDLSEYCPYECEEGLAESARAVAPHFQVQRNGDEWMMEVKDQKILSSAVFDVANFIQAAVNHWCFSQPPTSD